MEYVFTLFDDVSYVLNHVFVTPYDLRCLFVYYSLYWTAVYANYVGSYVLS